MIGTYYTFIATTPPPINVGSAPAPGVFALIVNVVLFVVISLLVALDLRATREQPLLANLGIGLRHTAAMTAGIVVPLEILFFLATMLAGASR